MKTKECPGCRGKGFEPCELCNGTGSRVPGLPCSYCNGTGKHECDVCEGEGYVEEE